MIYIDAGLTPSIKLDKAPESYGDGNVVMLFNNRISLAGKAFYDSPLIVQMHIYQMMKRTY